MAVVSGNANRVGASYQMDAGAPGGTALHAGAFRRRPPTARAFLLPCSVLPTRSIRLPAPLATSCASPAHPRRQWLCRLVPAAGPCWRAHARLLGAAGQPTAAPASRHVLAPARTQRRPSPPSRSTQRRPARQASGQQGARCGRRRGGDPPPAHRQPRPPQFLLRLRNSHHDCACTAVHTPMRCLGRMLLCDGCTAAVCAPRRCNSHQPRICPPKSLL